jgi:hypothetical protein
VEPVGADVHRRSLTQGRDGSVVGGDGAVSVLAQERAHSAARPGGGLQIGLGPADPLGLGDRQLHGGAAAGERVRGGFQEQSLGEQQVQVEPLRRVLTAQRRLQARASVEGQPAGSAQLQVDRGGGGQVAALGGQFPGARQAVCLVGPHQVECAELMGRPRRPQPQPVSGRDVELAGEHRLGLGEVVVARDPAEHPQRLARLLGQVEPLSAGEHAPRGRFRLGALGGCGY